MNEDHNERMVEALERIGAALALIGECCASPTAWPVTLEGNMSVDLGSSVDVFIKQDSSFVVAGDELSVRLRGLK